MNAISSAMQGMQTASAKLDGHAFQLARMSVDPDIDPAPELVGSLQASAAFQANLQTVRRANETLGSLLDLWA